MRGDAVADFCLQCNLALYFGPYSDFAHFGERGVITPEQVKAGLGMLVLCEGCGPIHVDDKGRCISEDCLCHGHTSPEAREVLRSAEEWLAARSGRLGPLLRLRDRFLGTPWEPGIWHELKYRWHSLWDDQGTTF